MDALGAESATTLEVAAKTLGTTLQPPPAGVIKAQPATVSTAMLDSAAPGVVKPAALSLEPQAMQTCLGGAGCQMKPAALATQASTALTPRKDFAPVIPIGIGVGELAIALAGGATLGAAAATAYDHMKSQMSSLGSLFDGGHQTSSIVDPAPATGTPPSATKPAQASSDTDIGVGEEVSIPQVEEKGPYSVLAPDGSPSMPSGYRILTSFPK